MNGPALDDPLSGNSNGVNKAEEDVPDGYSFTENDKHELDFLDPRSGLHFAFRRNK